MVLIGCVLAAVAGCGTTPANQGAKSSGGPLTLNVGYHGAGGGYTPLWMGVSQGYFKHSGVQVKLHSVQKASAMIAALSTKQLDALIAPAPLVVPAVAKGLPLVIVAGISNHMVDSLLAAPSIHSAAQLKGKTIDAGAASTTAYYAVDVELSLLHLSPGDVRLVTAGGNPTEYYSELVGGHVAATSLPPPLSFNAVKAGYRQLATTYKVPYQSLSVVVLRSRVAKLSPALVRFLEGYRYAMQQYNKSEQLAVSVLRAHTHLNAAVAKQTYRFYRRQAPFNVALTPTAHGLQNTIDFMSRARPAYKGVKASKIIDLSVLKQVPGVHPKGTQ